MPALRAAASASRALARPTLRYPLSFSGARAFSQSKSVLGGGGESHYDAPGGWLFGVKPGEKYEKEGWESVTYYGFVGSIIFGIVAYAFKPDTSIQTWALEEARRRLEAEGILPDPDTKSSE